MATVKAKPELPGRQISPPNVRQLDRWKAVKGQIQIQLNRTTFDTWIRNVELVGTVGDLWIIETPNESNSIWLEKHLAPALKEKLDRCLPNPGDPPIVLKIVTLGDDQFRGSPPNQIVNERVPSYGGSVTTSSTRVENAPTG